MFVWASLYTVTALADERLPERFDLLCQGKMEDNNYSFTLRFTIDLIRNKFCTDDYCASFSEKAGPKLQYHCKAIDGGKFCDPPPQSLAGRHIMAEDFVIDLSTGAFQRTLSVVEGDRVGRHFRASYSGSCATLPFTDAK
jgi:hypothetical protein